MHTLSKLVLGTALALALTPLGAQSLIHDDNSQNNLPDTRPIIEAMRHADLAALDAITAQHPDADTKLYVDMVRARITGNFDRSTALAQQCEQHWFESHPRLAVFCARMQVGNLRLAGHEQAARDAELAVIKRYSGHLPTDDLATIKHYADLYDSVPAFSAQRPQGAFSIPLVINPFRREDGKLHEGIPRAIAVQANGHKLLLDINTTAAFLTLDHDTASQLGVHVNQSFEANAQLSGKTDLQSGTLDTLQFNGVQLTNVPVIITPDSHRMVLGLDVLRQLGSFRLTPNALAVDASNAPDVDSHQPMLIASIVDGHGERLVLPLTVNDTPQTAVFNTGNPFYMLGTASALSQLDSRFAGQTRVRDTGKQEHREEFNRAKAKVVLGVQPIELTMGVLDDVKSPWPYSVGLSVLHDMDVYIDFTHHQLAFLPRDSNR